MDENNPYTMVLRYTQALEVYRQFDNVHGVVESHLMIGKVYRKQCDYELLNKDLFCESSSCREQPSEISFRCSWELGNIDSALGIILCDDGCQALRLLKVSMIGLEGSVQSTFHWHTQTSEYKEVFLITRQPMMEKIGNRQGECKC